MNEEGGQPDSSPSPEGEEDTSAQAPEARDEEARPDDELGEALREKDQFRRMAQRAQADLSNFKKRAEDEKIEARRSATSSVLLKLLTVVDDLDRALSLIPQDAVAPGWYGGLELVKRNIDGLLDAEGVTKIEALGKPFEPWELEAVHYIESPGADEGSVIEVIREGYKLHDRVLRAAQVIVAKKPEPVEQAEDAEEETE